jgi:malonate-semialdehyde dehydrogenase (acetylating) / methylmalonate-semialdehyde dehydrogenase
LDDTMSATPAPLTSASPARNLVAGAWIDGAGERTRAIRDPADSARTIAEVREASAKQVDDAVAAAAQAFIAWRATPAMDRARVLFRFRELLEAHFDDLAASVVRENGKLLSEAKGDVRRGVEVVEYACGIASHLMGRTLPEVSRNIDSYVVREPLGVVVGIPPFNFPAMIPLWTMPMAVACGNSFILKPSEKAPLTAARIAALLVESGAPAGVVSVVHGGREVSERLIADPRVQAVSFVGSSPVAESVYRLAAQHGKRAQALGGAKNHLLVMPDADLARSMPALVGSCFGCAGQRCLAGSVLIAVGDRARQDEVVSRFVESARALVPGAGMDPAATLCPLQGPESRERVLAWIERGVREGAKLALDGRGISVASAPRGSFVGATIFDEVDPAMAIAREEIFGPVVSVLRAADLDQAIALANRSSFGNSASIFTESGPAVRTFRARIQCGMLGVNLGVPAPMSMFSFGGWKGSIFGDLNAYGPDAVEFYTRKKVVSERWFGSQAPQEGWV